MCYSGISTIYSKIQNYDKAIDYSKRLISIVENSPDKEKVANEYFILSGLYIAKGDLSSAKKYLNKLKALLPKIDYYFKGGYYQNKASIYYVEKKYDSAFFYYKLVLPINKEFEHNSHIKTTLFNLSRIALKLGYLDDAKNYANQNLSLKSERNEKLGRIQVLQNLAEYYNKVGKTDKAFNLLHQSMEINDSLVSEENIKENAKLSVIYETEKKKQKIAQLQNDKLLQTNKLNQKKAFNRILIGSVIGLAVFAFLGYRNFRSKQKIAKQKEEIQNQKIIELEKDKQLTNIDAMLKVQEEERSRIAKDLHDGLGGLLSGTKLSFTTMKENLILTPENAIQFDKSLSMLDSTISDLRKVAHNLMPEALVKFGLNQALKDFCSSIKSAKTVNVIYQKLGTDEKQDNTTEVFIYRIIQELVNNALKHAQAKEILVQLATYQNKIHITVEDDGIRFDLNSIKTKKGAGLTNIDYRVKYLNGTIENVSSPKMELLLT